jgi:Uma2 family endonuclease
MTLPNVRFKGDTMQTPAPVLDRFAPPTRARVTLAEYFALPEGQPNYEFEDGELIRMNPPHARHQDLLLALGSELRGHIVRLKLGRIWPETELRLTGQRVYIPDLVFLATDHLDRYSDADGRLHGAPDLVVEILSPATRRRDRTTKLRAYQDAGVAWYWIVNPDDLWIEEYRHTPAGYVVAQSMPPGEIFAPGLFPELRIDLAALLGVTPVIEPEDDER